MWKVSFGAREDSLQKLSIFDSLPNRIHNIFSKNKKQKAITRDDLPHTSRKWISSMLKDDWKVCAKTGSSKINLKRLESKIRFGVKPRVFRSRTSHDLWVTLSKPIRGGHTPFRPLKWSYEAISNLAGSCLVATAPQDPLVGFLESEFVSRGAALSGRRFLEWKCTDRG